MSKSSKYSQNVFINCPIDDQYNPLFQAIVFTIHRLGLRPRCSREVYDSGGSRLEKIMDIMADCKYGIHDISRTQSTGNLPRFNMPLELGIDLGFRRAGGSVYQSKRHLIMDTAKYRYMKFISDLNGRDPIAHRNQQKRVVINVRNWLTTEAGLNRQPSGKIVFREFRIFKARLPKICRVSGTHADDMPFSEYSWIVADFLKNLKVGPSSTTGVSVPRPKK